MKINKHLMSILDKNFEIGYIITPIGHHDLGRHYVYYVNDKYKNEYILKIYGKQNRWIKEVTALETYKEIIPCPKIINKGILSDGTEWVILSKVPGVILEKVWDTINIQNKKQIMGQLGSILGKIHGSSKFDQYGTYKNKYSIDDFSLLEYRKEKDEDMMKNINNQNLPDKDLLERAYNEMVKYYDVLNVNIETRLCHHDFSPRNIMVVKEGANWILSSVLDFEHSYPDDPDIDFTDLYQTIFINEPNLEFYFLQGYSEHMKISKVLSEKMRYYLYNKGLFICSWSYNRSKEYYNEGINLINWLINSTK